MLLDTKKTLQDPKNELQRDYNWEFILPKLTNSAVDNILISSYIQSVKFGDYNIGTPYSQFLGAFKTYASSSLDIGTVNISILSPANGDVIRYFKDWKDLIVSQRGAYYFAKSNYVFACYCMLYARDYSDALKYKLINCFPKTFPAYTLDYNSNNFVKFDIELVVDAIETI